MSKGVSFCKEPELVPSHPPYKLKLHSEVVKHAVTAGITSLIAKAGQLKWVMKLDISWPKAVSIFRLSWSLPTVATDNTCPHHAEEAYRMHDMTAFGGLTSVQGYCCFNGPINQDIT